MVKQLLIHLKGIILDPDLQKASRGLLVKPFTPHPYLSYNKTGVKIMNECTCNNRVDCRFLAVAGSIIIGIVAGVLTFTGVISIGIPFLWVALGVGLLYLGTILLTAINSASRIVRECICSVLGILTVGILGTLLTAVILLGVAFAATSVLGAIISGALLTFLSLLVSSAVCLIKCIASCCFD